MDRVVTEENNKVHMNVRKMEMYLVLMKMLLYRWQEIVAYPLTSVGKKAIYVID